MEKMYHINLAKNDLKGAEYAILPGDPKRVFELAKMLDENFEHLGDNREYNSCLCNLKNNKKVLVISTGIGCPSVAICVEELASIGIKNFIRVGTTGAIQEHINLGDIILTKACVRMDGTSYHYAPLNYPAVASFSLTYKILASANDLNIKLHTGITATSDTFWQGQERYDSFSKFVRKDLKGALKEWQQMQVLNFEMEAACLFVMSSIFKLKASCICAVIAKRTENEVVDKSKYHNSIKEIMRILKKMLENE